MKRFWLLLFSLMVISAPVEAATDVKVQGNVIQITAIDTTDWIWTDDFPQARKSTTGTGCSSNANP